MQVLKSLPLILTLTLFTACNSTIEPKKEDNNITTTPSPAVTNTDIGTFSLSQVLIKQALDSYLYDLSTFNTNAIVEKTYPKLFQAIDRNLFRQYISSMMKSSDIEMKSYKSTIIKLSPVRTLASGTEFAQAEYRSTVKIHFLNNELYNNEEKITFLYDVFIHKYGKENIEVDVKNRTLQIKKLEKVLIIKENNSNEWKFLGDNKKYRQLYPSFLPYEILEAIDKK